MLADAITRSRSYGSVGSGLSGHVVSGLGPVTVGAEALEVAYAVVPGLVKGENVINFVVGVYNLLAHLTLPLCASGDDLFCSVCNLPSVWAAKVVTEQKVVARQLCVLAL